MTARSQAIIFDFDGVIADSERLHLRGVPGSAAPRGLTLTDEEYFDRYLGYDDVGVFRRYARIAASMGRRDGAAIVARKGERYDDSPDRGEMLFPGAASSSVPRRRPCRSPSLPAR